MLKKLWAGGLRGPSFVETTRKAPSAKADLLELAIAMLEAPPESAEAQDVLQRLDVGGIPFATAIERLRNATQLAVAARRRRS